MDAKEKQRREHEYLKGLRDCMRAVPPKNPECEFYARGYCHGYDRWGKTND